MQLTMNECSCSAGSYDPIQGLRVVDRRRLEHGFEARAGQGAELRVPEDVLRPEGVAELLRLLLKGPLPVLRVPVEGRGCRSVTKLAVAVDVAAVVVVMVWQRQC